MVGALPSLLRAYSPLLLMHLPMRAADVALLTDVVWVSSG